MSSVLNAVSQATTGAASAHAAAAQPARLKQAAEQFEGMMLNELMKPLHFGAAVDEAGEESGGGAGDTIRGMGTDALGKALAGHGGFGIAKKVVQQVAAQQSKTGRPAEGSAPAGTARVPSAR